MKPSHVAVDRVGLHCRQQCIGTDPWLSHSGRMIGHVTEVEARLSQMQMATFSPTRQCRQSDESCFGGQRNDVGAIGTLFISFELANLAKSRFLAGRAMICANHACFELFLGPKAQRNRGIKFFERTRLEDANRSSQAVAAMNELFNSLLDISRLDVPCRPSI